MKAVWCGTLVLGCASCLYAMVTEEPSGYELWGMRKRHVAVVNPVLGEDPAWTLDLGGEWEFSARRDHPSRNFFANHYQENETWENVRKLRVPGLVELQGVGEPGTSRPWECWWDCGPKPFRHVYVGAAWYRRTFDIPAAWAGRRIWLKVGGVAAQGWFWVNGTQVAWVDAYCGTYKYEITDLVTPGNPAKFVIQTSNEMSSRGGNRNSRNRWCGIVRALELEATPQTFMDDVWCRGDFNQKTAQVHVNMDWNDERGVVDKGLKVRATIDGQMVEVALRKPIPQSNNPSIEQSETVVKVPLKNFRPWSPEHPNLYTARVDLVVGGQVVQSRRERFGVRKLEVRGKDFYLNGRPFFVRGIGYHNMQPLYGNDRIGDRDYRRRDVGRIRAAGFNFIRTHTRCETPEFFDACDEAGVFVQPELPYYTDIPTERFEFNPVRDVKELHVHMRRHPSFAVYSHGNEGSFGPALGKHLHQLIHEMDPDRLVIDQDCDVSFVPVSARHDAPETSDFVGGPMNVWRRGSVQPDRPMVCHEYLNLTVKANAELEDRYTGIWQTPYGREKRRAWLAKSGLTDTWGKPLQLSQHALQAQWLKHGLESARLDPWCDGYSYWSAQDCTTPQGENYSAQGLFDPFFGDKPCGSTAESVAVYNSPTCVLCDTIPTARIAVSGEMVTNAVSLAHYGDADFENARLAWRLVARKGERVLASGAQDLGRVPLGGVRKLADVVFAVPELEKSVAVRFEVDVAGAKNAWDMWLFPRRGVRSEPTLCIADALVGNLKNRYVDTLPETRAATAAVVIAPYGSALAAEALARGQRVVAVGPATGEPNVKLGWWSLGSQVGTVFRDHPALAGLPHNGILNGLFFRILKQGGRQLPLGGCTEKDLIAVGEGAHACFLYLGQAKAAKGQQLMVFGLDVLGDTPEGTALLDGMVAYAKSEAFVPVGEVSVTCPKPLNGWARTLKAGDHGNFNGPYGAAVTSVARGTDGMTELMWETKSVPADVRTRKTFDFVFYGGQGYLAQPPVAFALYVNGEKAVDIPAVSLESKTWRQNGFVLGYTRDSETMECGWYTLTVPTEKLTPGKPATLRVVATVNRSRRWFSVHER